MTTIDSSMVNREFGQAKRAWRRVLAVQGILLALPLATLSGDKAASGICAVLGFVGSISLFLLKGTADAAYERAETARRAVMLEDGLGVGPDPTESMGLLSDATQRPSGDPGPVGGYYNSPFPKGPARLVHILWESAYCTDKVAGKVATHAMATALLGTATVVTGIIATLLVLPERPHAEAAANAAMILFGIFGLGMFAELCRTFRGLSAVAAETSLKCEGLLRQPSIELTAAMKTLERYNVAVGRAAPIPTYVWRGMQSKLAESWAAVQGGG